MSEPREPRWQGFLPGKGSEKPAELSNPPGLPELRFRAGDVHSFTAAMIEALVKWRGSTPVSDEGAGGLGFQKLEPGKQGLKHFNLTDDDNWLLGLIESWATVGDVLTFYQERILNEGFLRTAREMLSLYELARMLDYRPRPGVGASLHLAFQASRVEGLPGAVTIPPGTAVESTPPEADAPLAFETSTVLAVRSRWNRLTPTAPVITVPPVIRGDCTGVDLSGTPGLAPGAAVLVTAQTGGEERCFLRILDGAVPAPGDPPSTFIHWSEPLDAANPDHELGGVEIYALRQRTGLFGDVAPVWRDQPLAVKRRWRPIRGGMRVFSPAAGGQSINEGLEIVPIRCLLFDAEGNLYAGTAEGVFRRREHSDVWEKTVRGLSPQEIRALAADARGALLAGTADGNVYRSTDQGEIWTLLTGRAARAISGWTLPRRRSRRFERLPETAVRALWVSPAGGSLLFVGTDHGIYRSTDLGSSWLPGNQGLPGTDPDTGETNVVIEALVGLGGVLYAATPSGVFRTSDSGERWEAVNRGLPGAHPLTGLSSSPVRALAAFRDRRRQTDFLFAGTPEGVFRSTDGGATWEPARGGMAGEAVTALAVLDDPITVTTRVFAGTARGLWRSDDDGANWSEADSGTAAGVEALAVGPRGSRLAVATPFGGFADEEWPGFFLSRGRIDLNTQVSGVAAGSWVVLQPTSDGPGEGEDDVPPNGIYRVREVSAVHRHDFTLDSTVTRVEVEPDPELRRYDLRTTRVWLQSEDLPLLQRQLPPDPAASLESLLAVLGSLDGSRRLIVTGRRAGSLEGAEAAAGGEPAPSAPSAPPGFVGFTTAGELCEKLTAAAAEDRVELTAQGPAERADATAPRHRVAVELASLLIYANVVEATEGATIYEEVLGDGNAAQALQRFPLEHPLTYLRAAPRPRSTLQVRVQGQLWQEVPRLYGEGQGRRIYEIELDHQGNATVVFGDGVHGARLPSGNDNVVATYRTGMSHIDIPAHNVSMTSHPLGLAAVDNPIRGTPGAPPESHDEIREKSPRFILTFGRIVSVRDYEDFAISFPDVAMARSTALAVAGQSAIQLTVATYSGPDHRPAAGSRFLDELLAAIEEIRSDRGPVFIAPYLDVGFEVAAAVRIAPELSWELLEPRIRAALEERFGFAASRFDGRVRASEVIRVIQSVRGVVAVDLDRFRPVASSTPDELSRELHARSAEWDGTSTAPRPAELLLLSRCELERRG